VPGTDAAVLVKAASCGAESSLLLVGLPFRGAVEGRLPFSGDVALGARRGASMKPWSQKRMAVPLSSRIRSAGRGSASAMVATFAHVGD
jgi:hypothetical protein